ncbi:DNA starvation/stationary phase protection protein [Diaminobutyricibacter tongyongensis]|uniref:DNA starvation/stationary phase protection protein n=1 Tax=Leifsonia tongyongensis TaxID=1268043 RepID=A0A6L9XVV9_9MICO|nr:DNA starvation/stationary phase protection protein [Diaminobutyricibacter tongyongensis]NEN05436.1 DNA starvation/stationary phase protection protein [Diaminobutyricibacter tongyongensis]
MATGQTKSAQKASGKASASAGVHRTKRERSEHGFVASPALAECLQRVQADLIELHLQGKQAHWNIVGKNFRDLHLQLDEIVESAREFSDVIAERLRALHASPDGRSGTVAKATSLRQFPNGEVDTAAAVDLITERLEAVAGTARDVHDQVDDEDPTSADLLHQIIATLEQYAWMVSAENRTPASK